MRKITFCLTGCLFLFLTVHIANSAVVRCVSNESQLLSGLNESANSEEDYTIQLVKRIYNATSGTFVYSSSNTSSLTIEGGYTANCASRDNNPINPENTILDGQDFYQTLALVSMGETGTANFIIDGITVQSGKATSPIDGAGIYIRTENGNITISNSIVRDNHANRYAGGVYCRGAHLGDVSMINNVFENNTAGASYGHGGGAEIREARNVTISNNEFVNNHSGGSGGAIHLQQIRGQVSIKANIFRQNEADNDKGAALSTYVTSGNTNPFTLEKNIISGSTNGGAVFVDVYNQADITIRDNVIINNKGGSGIRIFEDPGSGIYPAQITLLNNIIASNEVYRDYGGGIDITTRSASTTLTITNNTITDNSTTGSGGGLRLALRDSTASALIYNNIIWGNNANVSSADLYLDNDADNDRNYADVELFNNDFNQSPPIIGAGGGFFVADTTFHTRIDPSNLNNINPILDMTAGSEFYLTGQSPCLNVGQNQAPKIPLFDIDGQPRIMTGTVDMGANEFTGAVLPVALFVADPLIGEVPLTVGFTDQSIGDVQTWSWTFGDGDTSSEKNPSHIYDEAGAYTVSLTVNGPDGSTIETKDDLIVVDLSAPVADAGIDRAITQYNIILDGSGSNDVDGSITSYDWVLNHRVDSAYDQSASGVNPTIMELVSGFYDVQLTVTDDDGLSNNDSMVLSVSEPWDVNNDHNLGLEEVIYILRILTGE